MYLPFIVLQQIYDLNIRPISYFRLIESNSQNNNRVNDVFLQLSSNALDRIKQKRQYQNFCKMMLQKMYGVKMDFKYPDQNNLLEKFIQYPNYLKVINDIICKSTDINIIMYVRLPMVDLFQQISNTYRSAKKMKKIQIVYFYQSSLPKEYKDIKQGVIIESKGFLETHKSHPNKSNNPIEFIIELYPEKHQKGNGYCHMKDDIVIINPFNKFYVKKVQKTNMAMKIILTYPIGLSKQGQKINSNQSKQQNQQKKKQIILQKNKKERKKQSNRKKENIQYYQQKKVGEQKQEQYEIFRRKKQEKKAIFIRKKKEQKEFLKGKKQEQKNIIKQKQNQYNKKFNQNDFQLDPFIILEKSMRSRDFWILKQLNMVYHHFNASKQVPSVWLYDKQMQLDSYKNKLYSISQYLPIDQISKLIDHLKQKQQTYHIIITKRISLPDPVMKILSQHSKSFYLINTNQFQKQIISLRYPDVVVCDDIQTIFKRFAQNLKKKTQSLFPLFANTSGDKSRINALRFNLQSLLSIRNIKRAKQDFVQLIKRLYDKSLKVQKFIQDYPLDGQIRKVLEWYTTPSFYPSLINNFLRMSNDLLELAYIRLPFFDLFNTIKRLYKDQKQTSQVTQTYRGGIIREEDLNCLKNNVGKVIEMYGFMSTSIDKAVAQSFAGNILFVIKIYQNKRSEQLDYGYADLKGYSAIVDQQQILFNALNTFKVEKVVTKGNIYEVTLKYGELAQIHYKKCNNMKVQKDKKIQLSKDEQNYLTNLQYQRNFDLYPFQGNILHITQKYEDSLLYYEKYLDYFKIRDSITLQTVFINYQIGKNLKEKFKYQEALKYFKKCKQIFKMIPIPKNYIGLLYFDIAKILNILGFHEKALQYNKMLLSMYQNDQDEIQRYKKISSNTAVTYISLKKYDKALEFYQKVGEIQFSSIDYFNMGCIHQQKKQFKKALSYFKKAFDLTIVTYGQNHYISATCYNQLGQIFKQQQKFKLALEYYKKAIIILNVFDENNLDLIISYKGIGQIYTYTKQFQKSIFYKQKALKIIFKIYGQKNSHTTKAYLSLVVSYLQIKEYKKCQQILLKCLINQQTKQNLSQIHFYLGTMYCMSINMDKAEYFLLKSLEIQSQFMHKAIACTHLGLIYFLKNGINKSREYFKKALNISLQIFNQKDIFLANIYNNLGATYQKEGVFHESLLYFSKSIQIYKQNSSHMQPQQFQQMFKVFEKMIQLYVLTNQFTKLQELTQDYLKYKLENKQNLRFSNDHILCIIEKVKKKVGENQKRILRY